MVCPGGIDANGCQMPEECIYVDPYSKGQTFCPVHCRDDEMLCFGGYDGYGYPMEDFCIPAKVPNMNDPSQDCPTFCTENCGPDMTYCPGGQDSYGCEMPGWCHPYDLTAICQEECPINCPENEYPCPMDMDERGCRLPDVCSVDGKCPGEDDTGLGDGCVNILEDEKCERKASKGKCEKPFVQRNCAKTCGICSESISG